MRKYEVLYITNAEYDEEKAAAVMKRYSDVVTAGKGIVTSAEKWGKRRLAYEINDLREGLYILMNFEGTREIAAELDRVMRIDQDVIRHMISRLDQPKRRVSPKKAVPKQEEKSEEPKVESAANEPVEVVAEAGEGPSQEAEAPQSRTTEENPQ